MGAPAQTPLDNPLRLPPGFERAASSLLNIGLFLFLGALLIGDMLGKWRAGRFDYVEASFAIQTTLLLAFVLLRRPAKAISTDPRHQITALVCFCSAAAFSTTPHTDVPGLLVAAKVVMVISNLLGLLTVATLGKSFGILVALRSVKSRGLYGVIRHPMYLTDILLRVGLVLQAPTAWNVALALGSSGLYLLRAHYEEAFLAQDPDYRAYMTRVRYRFLPGVY
jgi:protein-S-isoprenylcysteine O-methyltransferase Ste14